MKSNLLCRGTAKRFLIHLKPRRTLKLATAAILAGSVTLAEVPAQSTEPIYLDQGQNWSAVARGDFYTRDQGSRLIPFAWLKSLKYPDGQPFLADQLGRYGYLPNPGNPDGLPVGFTKGGDFVGMNCAACHSRQISVSGKEYRIDGGPAIVDAQSMFVVLDKAVGGVLTSDTSFLAFAKEVLGQPNPDNNDVVLLKAEVKAWFLRYDTLIQRGMPTPAWGPGRMDAVGMIFNRLTGLDIGPPSSFIIADNIKKADAPVRYPFLWNATIQDKTQWPGFADNGSDTLGLARNLGEVYGVFADFTPRREWWHVLGVDYLHNNSANFDGLGRLEELIKKIGPPKYPWPIDPVLAAQGKIIFDRSTKQGGCKECHGVKPNETNNRLWTTPIMDVGTDSRQYDILEWTAKTGVLEGKNIPTQTEKLLPTDKAFNILSLSVKGTLIQHYVPVLADSPPAPEVVLGVDPSANGVSAEAKLMADKHLADARMNFKLPTKLQDLKGAFIHPSDRKALPADVPLVPVPPGATPNFKYESRVMQGIWAAAPYLHNGSVPTLADLLEPAAKRPDHFKIGPNYNIDKVGIAEDQTKFGDQTLTTTKSTDRNSGNANCGHEFGTTLEAKEKTALLEYLKSL